MFAVRVAAWLVHGEGGWLEGVCFPAPLITAARLPQPAAAVPRGMPGGWAARAGQGCFPLSVMGMAAHAHGMVRYESIFTGVGR